MSARISRAASPLPKNRAGFGARVGRILVGITVFAFCFLSLNSARAYESRPSAKPNIVFILADDLGYGDLPGPGLYWSFSTESGVLSVVAVPALHLVASKDTLTISWLGPAFHLQAQTSSLMLGVSSNWFDYPGGSTSPVIIAVNLSKCLFLRLISP